MKMQDVLPKMSKLYLNRTVDSFLKNVQKTTEDDMRCVILKNIEEFRDEMRVKHNLNFLEEERDIDVLNQIVLMCLLECDNYLTDSASLMQSVLDLEQSIVDESKNEQYISASIPNDSYRIYSAVLDAAWKKDESLNAHEKNILNVLRRELRLSKRHHHLIEARIGRFPKKGNILHSHNKIEDALRNLQNRGIVLRFRTDKEYFVIPEEIARVVRYEVGGELKTNAYKMLLDSLRVEQLRSALKNFSLSSSGPKPKLIERIIQYDRVPSMVLGLLTSDELAEILRRLDGVRISGTKENRIENIIVFYENYKKTEVSDPTDERSKFYDFIEELAKRNYELLRKQNIIEKDIDIDRYFEEATRYLFEKKLNLALVEQPGSNHSDGKLRMNSKESVLWDNKSTEKKYDFPQEHFDQFLQYIRADSMRTTLFLVVVGDYTDNAVSQAYKLKALSEKDTDVALIKAEDLKFVAENWHEHSKLKCPVFNLEVFNITGELTRDMLESRMSWALSIRV
jgi:hypothetical protein